MDIERVEVCRTWHTEYGVVTSMNTKNGNF